MGGALMVAFVGHRYVLKRPAPYMSTGFQLPTRRDLDLHLIGGSAVFGVGWGIAGFGPGGALPAIGPGRTEVLILVAVLLCGIVAVKLLQAAIANRAQAQA